MSVSIYKFHWNKNIFYIRLAKQFVSSFSNLNELIGQPNIFIMGFSSIFTVHLCEPNMEIELVASEQKSFNF